MKKRTAETFTTEDRKDWRLGALELEYAQDPNYRSVESEDSEATHYISRDLLDQVGKDILDDMAVEAIVQRQIRIRDYRASKGER